MWPYATSSMWIMRPATTCWIPAIPSSWNLCARNARFLGPAPSMSRRPVWTNFSCSSTPSYDRYCANRISPNSISTAPSRDITSRQLLIARRRQFPGAHEILELDAKSAGEAIDVIEVADDLSGVVNSVIVKAMLSQQGDIAVADPGRIVGEPFGVAAKRRVG